MPQLTAHLTHASGATCRLAMTDDDLALLAATADDLEAIGWSEITLRLDAAEDSDGDGAARDARTGPR